VLLVLLSTEVDFVALETARTSCFFPFEFAFPVDAVRLVEVNPRMLCFKEGGLLDDDFLGAIV
jgi:hypothetical protein